MRMIIGNQEQKLNMLIESSWLGNETIIFIEKWQLWLPLHEIHLHISEPQYTKIKSKNSSLFPNESISLTLKTLIYSTILDVTTKQHDQNKLFTNKIVFLLLDVYMIHLIKKLRCVFYTARRLEHQLIIINLRVHIVRL